MASLSMTIPVPGVTARGNVALATRARGWGYASIWAAEVDGPEAMSLLGAAATAAPELDLGLAVAPVQTRTAFVLAMAALTLQDLTGGRFSLGVGASSQVLVERFGGVTYTKPLTHVREMVEALRPALAGERSTLDGEFVRIGGYRWPLPVMAPVPLYLGSLNRASLQLAGALADGLCINQMTVEHTPRMLTLVREGAAAANRALPADFPVVARLFCSVTDDPAPVKSLLPHVFAPYVATEGYARFYSSMGFGDQVAAIRAASAQRDKAAMAAAYTPEMVDAVFAVGTAGEVVDRIQAHVAAGVTVATIAPVTATEDDAAATFAAIGAEWRRRYGS